MNKELLQERKKMIYDFICDELYVPMKAKEMAIVLNVPKSQRGELLEVLDALTADGKVEISGRGKYVKSEGKYLTGVFTAHPRGFGFVTVEGEEEDIFIPAAQTNGALHKDTVQITLSKNSSGKRKEGTVTRFYPEEQSSLSALMKKVKPLVLQCRTIRDLRRIFLFRWSGQRERFPGTKLWWRSQIMEKTAKSRREKSLRSSDISTIRGQISCPL